jgi:hypothetical protein
MLNYRTLKYLSSVFSQLISDPGPQLFATLNIQFSLVIISVAEDPRPKAAPKALMMRGSTPNPPDGS